MAENVEGSPFLELSTAHRDSYAENAGSLSGHLAFLLDEMRAEAIL
jgi:hypothetical protein